MGRSLHRGASKPQREEIARFRSNPPGQWLCGRSTVLRILAIAQLLLRYRALYPIPQRHWRAARRLQTRSETTCTTPRSGRGFFMPAHAGPGGAAPSARWPRPAPGHLQKAGQGRGSSGVVPGPESGLPKHLPWSARQRRAGFPRRRCSVWERAGVGPEQSQPVPVCARTVVVGARNSGDQRMQQQRARGGLGTCLHCRAGTRQKTVAAQCQPRPYSRGTGQRCTAWVMRGLY
jgi:hypothetical protein